MANVIIFLKESVVFRTSREWLKSNEDDFGIFYGDIQRNCFVSSHKGENVYYFNGAHPDRQLLYYLNTLTQKQVFTVELPQVRSQESLNFLEQILSSLNYTEKEQQTLAKAHTQKALSGWYVLCEKFAEKTQETIALHEPVEVIYFNKNSTNTISVVSKTHFSAYKDSNSNIKKIFPLTISMETHLDLECSQYNLVNFFIDIDTIDFTQTQSCMNLANFLFKLFAIEPEHSAVKLTGDIQWFQQAYQFIFKRQLFLEKDPHKKDLLLQLLKNIFEKNTFNYDTFITLWDLAKTTHSIQEHKEISKNLFNFILAKKDNIPVSKLTPNEEQQIKLIIEMTETYVQMNKTTKEESPKENEKPVKYFFALNLSTIFNKTRNTAEHTEDPIYNSTLSLNMDE